MNHLGDALHHLLDNACRYTPQDGYINVVTGSDAAYVWLEVRDNGPGIAPENLPHVFDSFWREDDAHSTPGFGLGLTIARKVAQLHGGDITVSSVVGQGTTFRIYLPAHASAETRAENGPAASQPGSGKSETILLVEDEPAILKMTTLMLERLGYAILAANTPAKAIELNWYEDDQLLSKVEALLEGVIG